MDVVDKAEEVMAVSDEGGDAADDGTVSPSPVTVPKKRGRPANPDKQPKKPVPGRGRGRPSKSETGASNKKPIKQAATADGSDEEGTASDGGSPLPNGDPSSGGRGRPPKAKRKLAHTIEATGRGRGRPKKTAKPDTGEDDDEAADDNDDAESGDYKPGKKAAPASAKAGKKGRGRPKKVQNSDDESSDDKLDDEEERRPLGRPPSSGVNLNIVATGRGLGRPKKGATSTARRVAKAENGSEDATPKKRGRPVTTGKGPYQPSGKPRGRPKVASPQGKDSQDDEKEEDDENDVDEKPPTDVTNNSGDDDDAKMNSDSDDEGL